MMSFKKSKIELLKNNVSKINFDIKLNIRTRPYLKYYEKEGFDKVIFKLVEVCNQIVKNKIKIKSLNQSTKL